MLYNYIAIVFFSLFAIFIPASFLFTSWLLRDKVPSNPVKNAPYESGEESIGGSRDIDTEYFPFIMLFLPFEVIAILVLVWSYAAGIMGKYPGLYMILLLLSATAFSIVGYKAIDDNHGE